MPDKKLTDAEIKKALECCMKLTPDCDDCPYWGVRDFGNCFDFAGQDALDLFNRLQAKVDDKEDTIQYADKVIKQLEKCKDTLICEKLKLLQQIENLQAENEELKRESDVSIEDIHSLSDQVNELIEENEELKSAINGFRGYEDKIKAEAYKECAEKIKQKTLAMIYSPGEISTDDYIGCIDDVVKELEGEN